MWAFRESLRPIRGDLAEAVQTCLEAALCEQGGFNHLLKAASFGRHFAESAGPPDRHREACRSLRICTELRKAPIEIPITAQQLEKLGMAGLTLRLAQRHFHLLGARICEWVGHCPEKILFHWACAKIRRAKGSPQTDEQLCHAILEKFQRCPGIGFAEVARVAAEMYRPHLATLLLNHEPRSHAQIQVLVQLSRGDERDREIMLRLAFDKAARSWDPDLVHSAVNAACSGDVCQRGADLQSCARLIKEKPQELQVASDLVTGALLRAGNFERARMFNELLDRKRPAAFAALSRVFVQTSYEERLKLLRFSKDLFALTEGPEAEKASMQFMSQACADELELLSAQAGLEEKASAKNWGRGREVRFLGLPLVTSLLKLIELEEVKEADELRAKMRMVDKRYWRIKIRGLASCGNFDELNAFAILASPIGYEPFVEAFLKAGRNDFALALVPKVKSGEQQALYYQQMNLHEEAQRARQGQDRGAGRLLNFFAGR
ncbi:unnamed protein product [Effrenium voratum]|nr:unnamed protein product [Effrenium voratum]